ncbi:SDR family NAD(P)-dependent oxidoreductase [Paraflavisolibacter sp. H34]|uniref:SDR family NAD(P)-dependent oxidoreductase n=1 Tax=Huijunlia imazamoxiresistens TaxID=3127457 RepID=UPI00301851E1
MARIVITGSADGLGQLAAKALIAQGHKVVVHARNAQRGREALQKNPGAESVVTGDLSSILETIRLAHAINSLGPFDAVIHNAGVYQVSAPEVFAVNTLAPYILTCLVQRPKRLIYLSSGMHLQGRAHLEHFYKDTGRITYSDSKLHVLLLCKAAARRWPQVLSNAVDPGWVPTRMGGRGAPDDLQKGYETQVWLAVSNEERAQVSGRYFFHQKERRSNPGADDVSLQERFLHRCEEITGISFPE